MEVKKDNWNKSRDILPAYVGVSVPSGRAARPHPYLPPETVGEVTITIVVMGDDELKKKILEKVGIGENYELERQG